MSESKPSATSATILGSGKSSRLLEMRNKSLNLSPNTENAKTKPETADQPKQNPEFLLVRQLIDQRMADILTNLPSNKQRSLFKIRFGIDLDTVHQQPIGQLIKILKIQHPKFERPSADMKNVMELTYNGQPAQ